MISRFNLEEEFETSERCYITEIHNTDKDTNCSIVRARVEEGVTTQLHSLTGVEERYVVLSGSGKVEVGDKESTEVKPLDVVYIKAGEPQRITNTGEGDLIFMCICTPRFTVECYKNME